MRIRKYLTVEQARLLANAFIVSQFNYAPFTRMFAGKTLIKHKLKKFDDFKNKQISIRSYVL